MDLLIRLLVISTLGCVSSEVGAWGARGAGAGEVGRGYEPLMFAAVPLHAPVPVLHVLSPTPLRTPARPSSPRRRPATAGADLELDETAPPPVTRYGLTATATGAGKQRDRVRPTYRDTDYEESYEYTRLTPPGPRPYAYEEEYGSYAPVPAAHLYSTVSQYDTYAASSAETTGPLLYARRSPSGGYTYRRAAAAAAAAASASPKVTAPPPTKTTREPQYILKIHKYRIVKDRRRRRR